MKEFDFENQAKNLPDSFAKSPDSNNYKILTNEKKYRYNPIDIQTGTDITLSLLYK